MPMFFGSACSVFIMGCSILDTHYKNRALLFQTPNFPEFHRFWAVQTLPGGLLFSGFSRCSGAMYVGFNKAGFVRKRPALSCIGLLCPISG